MFCFLIFTLHQILSQRKLMLQLLTFSCSFTFFHFTRYRFIHSKKDEDEGCSLIPRGPHVHLGTDSIHVGRRIPSWRWRCRCFRRGTWRLRKKRCSRFSKRRHRIFGIKTLYFKEFHLSLQIDQTVVVNILPYLNSCRRCFGKIE